MPGAVEAALALLVAAGLYGLDWLSLAPNRLLSGTPASATAALGLAAHGVQLLVLGAAALRRYTPVALLLLAGAFAGALAATGLAAGRMLEDQAPTARVMLGPGFWLALAAMLLLGAALLRQAELWLRLLALAGALAVAGAILASGALEPLSLVHEYRARAGELHAALLRHIVLAALALAIALAGAAPLAWWAFRSRRAEAALGAALGGVQIIPALALFAALIPALSLLLAAIPALRTAGLEAIGATPALIGAAAYAGLPLWRGILAGLAAAPHDVVEVAEAMGMAPPRLLAAVRLPLGVPVFCAALRVAAVQCIALVTLGGLIGAGGLGAVVLEGMAQFATDLILLGALPILALALLADAALRGVEAGLAPWRA